MNKHVNTHRKHHEWSFEDVYRVEKTVERILTKETVVKAVAGVSGFPSKEGYRAKMTKGMRKGTTYKSTEEKESYLHENVEADGHQPMMDLHSMKFNFTNLINLDRNESPSRRHTFLIKGFSQQ